MTQHLEPAAAFITATTGAIFGSRMFALLADVASNEMPEWMKWLLGPLGALVGMIVAVWWLSNRLNKAEEKADKREDERDADRKTLINVLAQNSLTLESNSSVLKDVKTVMERASRNTP